MRHAALYLNSKLINSIPRLSNGSEAASRARLFDDPDPGGGAVPAELEGLQREHPGPEKPHRAHVPRRGGGPGASRRDQAGDSARFGGPAHRLPVPVALLRVQPGPGAHGREHPPARPVGQERARPRHGPARALVHPRPGNRRDRPALDRAARHGRVPVRPAHRRHRHREALRLLPGLQGGPENPARENFERHQPARLRRRHPDLRARLPQRVGPDPPALPENLLHHVGSGLVPASHYPRDADPLLQGQFRRRALQNGRRAQPRLANRLQGRRHASEDKLASRRPGGLQLPLPLLSGLRKAVRDKPRREVRRARRERLADQGDDRAVHDQPAPDPVRDPHDIRQVPAVLRASLQRVLPEAQRADQREDTEDADPDEHRFNPRRRRAGPAAQRSEDVHQLHHLPPVRRAAGNQHPRSESDREGGGSQGNGDAVSERLETAGVLRPVLLYTERCVHESVHPENRRDFRERRGLPAVGG